MGDYSSYDTGNWSGWFGDTSQPFWDTGYVPPLPAGMGYDMYGGGEYGYGESPYPLTLPTPPSTQAVFDVDEGQTSPTSSSGTGSGILDALKAIVPSIPWGAILGANQSRPVSTYTSRGTGNMAALGNLQNAYDLTKAREGLFLSDDAEKLLAGNISRILEQGAVGMTPDMMASREFANRMGQYNPYEGRSMLDLVPEIQQLYQQKREDLGRIPGRLPAAAPGYRGSDVAAIIQQYQDLDAQEMAAIIQELKDQETRRMAAEQMRLGVTTKIPEWQNMLQKLQLASALGTQQAGVIPMRESQAKMASQWLTDLINAASGMKGTGVTQVENVQPAVGMTNALSTALGAMTPTDIQKALESILGIGTGIAGLF